MLTLNDILANCFGHDHREVPDGVQSLERKNVKAPLAVRESVERRLRGLFEIQI